MRHMLFVTPLDSRFRFEQIRCPVLVIHGDADRVMPVANGKRIAEYLSDGHLEVMAGVGHMFWSQKPAATVKICTDFLASTPAAQIKTRPGNLNELGAQTRIMASKL